MIRKNRLFSLGSVLFLLLAYSAHAETEEEIYQKYLAIHQDLPERMDFSNASQRNQLYRMVNDHPVTDPDNLGKYDKRIGFCFGRAMGVQLMARKMGFSRASLGKLFVIGDLLAGGEPWRFHVTATIRGEDNQWYTIDPVMYRVLPLNSWIMSIREGFDPKHTARFYITQADSIMPDVTKDMNGTTGENIIELGFVARNRAGFTEVAQDVFQVDSDAADRYMITTTERTERFNFENITIGNETFDYKDYFRELINDLAKRKRPMRAPRRSWQAAGANQCLSSMGALSDKPTSLLSPMFWGQQS